MAIFRDRFTLGSLREERLIMCTRMWDWRFSSVCARVYVRNKRSFANRRFGYGAETWSARLTRLRSQVGFENSLAAIRRWKIDLEMRNVRTRRGSSQILLYRVCVRARVCIYVRKASKLRKYFLDSWKHSRLITAALLFPVHAEELLHAPTPLSYTHKQK